MGRNVFGVGQFGLIDGSKLRHVPSSNLEMTAACECSELLDGALQSGKGSSRSDRTNRTASNAISQRPRVEERSKGDPRQCLYQRNVAAFSSSSHDCDYPLMCP